MRRAVKFGVMGAVSMGRLSLEVTTFLRCFKIVTLLLQLISIAHLLNLRQIINLVFHSLLTMMMTLMVPMMHKVYPLNRCPVRRLLRLL